MFALQRICLYFARPREDILVSLFARQRGRKILWIAFARQRENILQVPCSRVSAKENFLFQIRASAREENCWDIFARQRDGFFLLLVCRVRVCCAWGGGVDLGLGRPIGCGGKRPTSRESGQIPSRTLRITAIVSGR